MNEIDNIIAQLDRDVDLFSDKAATIGFDNFIVCIV